MQTELKPCPFCGRTDKLVFYETVQEFDDCEIHQYTIYCDASGDKTGCGASCGYQRTKEEAIEAWNRRVNLDDT